MFLPVAITSAGSTDSHAVTSSAIDTTGATLIVVNVSTYAGATAAVLSDSKSNTWSALTVKASTGTRSRLFYCAHPTVGTAHTFTLSTGSSYPTIAVAAFSGADTNPFDQESGAFTNSPVTTLQPGSLTPTDDRYLVVAGVTHTGTAATIDSGFTASTVDYLDSFHFAGGIAYKIQTTAAAVNPAWTWTTASEAATVMATFSPYVLPSNTINAIRNQTIGIGPLAGV